MKRLAVLASLLVATCSCAFTAPTPVPSKTTLLIPATETAVAVTLTPEPTRSPTPLPTPSSPQDPVVTINMGAASTNSRFVVLTLAVKDKAGIVGYFVSESSATPSLSAMDWVTTKSAGNYSAEVPFTLSTGDGIKTVYAWFKNAAGKLSSVASARILLASRFMDNVHELAVTPDGKELYAWSMETRNILVVDMQSEDYPVIAEIKLPGNRSAPYSSIIFSPDGRYAFLHNALQCLYDANCEDFGAFNQVLVIDTQSKRIVSAIRMPSPYSPTGQLAISPDGNQLYLTVADFGAGALGIAKLDVKTQTMLGFLQLNGANFLTISSDGKRLYVSQGWSIVGLSPDLFSVVDAASFRLIASIPVGKGPQCISIKPDGSKAYVCNAVSNDVSVIDLVEMKVKTTIPVGPQPRRLAITPDGKKGYVGNTGQSGGATSYQFGNTVSVLDLLADKRIKDIQVHPEPASVVMDPRGTKVYVSDGSANGPDPAHFHVIDVTKDVYQRDVIIRGAAFYTPTGIDIAPDGRRLFVVSEVTGNLLAIDVSDRTTVARQRIYPRAVKVSRDGHRVYAFSPLFPIANQGMFFVLDADSLAILESLDLGKVSGGRIGSTIAYRIVLNNNEDTAYVTNNADKQEVIVVDLKTKKVVTRISVGEDRNVPANGIAITPDGTKVFASSCAGQSVSVIDTTRNAVIDTVKVGNCPSEIVLSRDGKRAYVLQQHTTATMSIIDVDSRKVIRVIENPMMINAALDFALSADERFVYIACFDPNWVMVYDLTQQDFFKLMKTVIKTGLDPYYLTTTSDMRFIYVTNLTSDSISVIDTQSNAVVDSIQITY